MKEIKTIHFVDQESNGECVAIIRAKKGCVGLCVSSIENGDVEVFVGREVVKQVIAGLEEALLASAREVAVNP
jgi:hypothetical protein